MRTQDTQATGELQIRRSRRERRCGSRRPAARELLLVVPLIGVLAFSILSYAGMVSFREAISDVAAQGARVAAQTHGGLTSDERTVRAVGVINEGLERFGVSCADGVLKHGGTVAGRCVVSEPRVCRGPGNAELECVSVTLAYRYRANSVVPVIPWIDIVLPREVGYSVEVELES